MNHTTRITLAGAVLAPALIFGAGAYHQSQLIQDDAKPAADDRIARIELRMASLEERLAATEGRLAAMEQTAELLQVPIQSLNTPAEKPTHPVDAPWLNELLGAMPADAFPADNEWNALQIAKANAWCSEHLAGKQFILPVMIRNTDIDQRPNGAFDATLSFAEPAHVLFHGVPLQVFTLGPHRLENLSEREVTALMGGEDEKIELLVELYGGESDQFKIIAPVEFKRFSDSIHMMLPTAEVWLPIVDD